MGRIKAFNKHKFRGNQYLKIKNNSGNVVTPPRGDSNLESNTTPQSASRKKLLYLSSDSAKENITSVPGSQGNIIIDLRVLSEFINKSVLCSRCKSVNSVNIVEETGSRRGLASKIRLECKFCKYENSTMTSCVNPRKISCVNIRFSYAMRCIGKGRQAARTFCAVMDLPPPPVSFDRYNQVLFDGLQQVAESSMLNAAKQTKEMEGSADTTVVVDGSWQKRGHTSLHGVVTATSFLSGKVLDVVTFSKYCTRCARGGDHYCMKNFDGYSGGMEVQGAVQLCTRSEISRGLRYIRYLGDGDSKGFNAVNEAKPYGNNITIEKLECIGHVQKRMGRLLRQLCKEFKGQKLEDGKLINGRGRLTNAEIDKLQNYYGMAIRANVDNLNNMKKAVWATYFHKYSTDDKPNHGLCPKGSTSWCGYQRSVTAGIDYEHKHSLPPAILDRIKPIYKKLADESLLRRCLHGKTQNQNESFNSCIWQRVPKTVFVGAKTVKIGVLDSVICFNDGSYSRTHVMKAMDIEPGENMKKGLRDLDVERVMKADTAMEKVTKEARMKKRGKKRQREDRETQKDESYGPGKF